MSEELPTSGGFWASVGAIALTLAGGAGVAVKAWFNRKRTAAATGKTDAEADLAKAKARAMDAETEGELLRHVRRDYRRIREELDQALGRINDCEADRAALHKLAEKQARDIADLLAWQKNANTRMGKLETALTLLGKDPKLVS